METLTKYIEEGYIGVDASLDISLYEYGLIWKETSSGEYNFIYGINSEDDEYSFFDYGFMSIKDWDNMLNDSWFDLKAVESFSGDKLSFPYDVHTALQYHGYQNIFGESYREGFTIVNDTI